MKKELRIGRGKEHNVYPDPNDARYVIKIPRKYNAVLLKHVFGGVKTLLDEVKETQRQVSHSDESVRVPETQILFTRTGYIMRQRRIYEDYSVPNIQRRLMEHGLTELATRHTSNPKNFLTEDGIVYIVDPTRVWMHRLFDKLSISPDVYRKVTNVLIRGQKRIRYVFRSSIDEV